MADSTPPRPRTPESRSGETKDLAGPDIAHLEHAPTAVVRPVGADHDRARTLSPSADRGAIPAGQHGIQLGEEAGYVPGTEEERRLVRKIDMRLLPILWVMYCLNYLDRTNISNARVAGMAVDLHLSSSDYSLALSIFFVAYLLLEVPSNMLLTRSKPSLYLPTIMLVWGCVSCAVVGVKTKNGLIGIRIALGIVESGFFPGVMLLLSNWYRKAELSRRIALFYSAAITSGAFGGLLAGGITKNLDGHAGIRGWKWLFLIEGVLTVVFALLATLILPNFPATTSWLTDSERALAVKRLAVENNADGKSSVGQWRGFLMAVQDWRTWAFMFLYLFVVSSGTISYFIPTLTDDLGYKGTSAQWMTVPIYAVAFVFSIAGSFSSDYFKERTWHISAFSLLAVVAFVVCCATENAKVRYAMLCFGAAGIWSALPICLAFTSNVVSAPNIKRSVTLAIVNMLGNLSSVFGSYIWPTSSAPGYIPGFATTTCLMFACFVTVQVISYFNNKYPYPWAEETMARASAANPLAIDARAEAPTSTAEAEEDKAYVGAEAEEAGRRA